MPSRVRLMPPRCLLGDLGRGLLVRVAAGWLKAHHGQVAVNQSLVAESSQPVQDRLPKGSARVRSAARLLRELLLEREDYLDRWQRFWGRAPGTGALSQAAVARVIADHL
jgi:hypothetical protein